MSNCQSCRYYYNNLPSYYNQCNNEDVLKDEYQLIKDGMISCHCYAMRLYTMSAGLSYSGDMKKCFDDYIEADSCDAAYDIGISKLKQQGLSEEELSSKVYWIEEYVADSDMEGESKFYVR